MMILSLPETSANNILLPRARRLRKITGKKNLLSQSEIDQAGMNSGRVAYEALIKPWQMNALDPAVVRASFSVYEVEFFEQLTDPLGLCNALHRLIYGIFYSFVEPFPLVFPECTVSTSANQVSHFSRSSSHPLFACHPTAVTTTMWSNPK
jgi:DHA1 family multidrug resistance protein-like MFS transporter